MGTFFPKTSGVLAGFAFFVLLVGAELSSAQDCGTLVEQFNRSVDAGNESEAQQLVDRIATDAQCGRMQVAAQRRLAAFRLQTVQALMARGRPVGDYDRLLTEANRPEVLWQAAATLGEVRFGERRFADAARAFDRAIEIVKNETLTPVAPSQFDIDGLIERAGQARLLSADAVTVKNGEGFVKTAQDHRDGSLGGIYSPSIRGIIPRAIPIPITFEFAKTTFTSVGQEAVRELALALKEQQPSQIVLVGHTDIRGAAEANLQLSRDRAEAVSAFLRENGISATIKTVGKGATEPMRLSDTSGLSQEDIYALNRRVEWRRE